MTGQHSTLRIAISDFWWDFDPLDSFLWQSLADRWQKVEFADDADILVYGPFGRHHARRRGAKVFCSAEPQVLPRRHEYDYSISWHVRDDDRHVRAPLGVWYMLQYPDAIGALDSRSFEEWSARPYFCNFIYSNVGPSERRDFFAALSRRRFVHSPGAVETNTDPVPGGRGAYDWWRRKIAYQRQFRFSIAFESLAIPGYTSEKAGDALLAGSIPIYWGNPEISRDVDPSSFIDASAFPSWDELAEYIVCLDDNRELARPFFECREPVLVDLDQTKRSIATLFVRAQLERSFGRRFHRTLRPLLLLPTEIRWVAVRALRKVRRVTMAGVRGLFR